MKAVWGIVLLLLTACADPARNLYEGIRNNNDSRRTPMERATQPAPDYDAYRDSLEKEERP